MMMTIGQERQQRLRAALDFSSYSYTAGKTHHFYHYPARFSPEFARTVIAEFSEPTDCILDPFMGGGTSIIEGLALGRTVVGIDINALAHFVARTRTTPLSQSDEVRLTTWAQRAAILLSSSTIDWIDLPGIRNLPRPVETFLAGALVLAMELPFRRQRALHGVHSSGSDSGPSTAGILRRRGAGG
jgi:hypothetical protein